MLVYRYEHLHGGMDLKDSRDDTCRYCYFGRAQHKKTRTHKFEPMLKTCVHNIDTRAGCKACAA